MPGGNRPSQPPWSPGRQGRGLGRWLRESLRGHGVGVLGANSGLGEDVGWPGAAGRVGCHRHRDPRRFPGCLRRHHQQRHASPEGSGDPDHVRAIWRNQPTRMRRPSTARRRGAWAQASKLTATRVIGPSEGSRPAMRAGSSASGFRERGHHPPSRDPVPAIVGSNCSRGADGWVGGTAVGSLLLDVMSSVCSRFRVEPPCRKPRRRAVRAGGSVVLPGRCCWRSATTARR
jgi:hypothetical protein